MFRSQLHKNESGQTALETAIILIAFVVVASVFAFTILSAGSASTQRGEEAIYAGLEGVQASLQMRGAVIAEANGAGTAVDNVIFTVAPVSGGDPIDVTATAADRVLIIDYRDGTQRTANVDWTVTFIGANDADDLLEEGELAEIEVDLTGLGTALAANVDFTLEVKPPSGGVLLINRTTPAGLETFMELR
jgi:flagellin FlaB